MHLIATTDVTFKVQVNTAAVHRTYLCNLDDDDFTKMRADC